MGYDELLAELTSQGIYPKSVMDKVADSIKERDEQIISEMEALTGLHYSEDQRQVLSHRGNLNIIACAGSGKTTSLAHLITKRIKSGEIADTSKMVCTTFSKDGATDLAKRIKTVMQSAGLRNQNLRVCTLHAFFYELIRTFGVNKEVISEGTRASYIREACKKVLQNIQKDDIATINTWISYQINNLYSDTKILKKADELTIDITVEDYANIRKLFAYSKEQAGQIDFDDMQLLIYTWACAWAKSENEAERNLSAQVRNYCKAMFSYYFIDEAQDISKIQFRILKALILSDDEKRTESNVVFIGDDDQAIYSWRGSDPSIILGLGAVFDLQTFMLNTNYRCGKNILEFSAKGIANNVGRYHKAMQAFNSDGEVNIKIFDNSIYDYSRHAVEIVKELIGKGYNPKDIAILTRQNNHACLLGYMLAEEGIYYTSREEMKFKNQQVYADIKDLLAIAEGDDTKFNVKRILWKLLSYFKAKLAGSLADEIESYNLRFSDWLDVLFNKDSSVALDSRVKTLIRNNAYDKIKSKNMDELKEIHNALMRNSYEEKVESLLYIYMSKTFEYLYKNEDVQRVVKGAIRYTVEVVKKMGLSRAKDFWRIMEQFESGSMDVPGDKITISTVHSSKGREWDAVILFAVDFIGFPNKKKIENALVSLSSAKVDSNGVTSSEIDDYINEERRLFYVGCTRAKSNLTIETCRTTSPFLLESLKLVPEDYSKPNEFIKGVTNCGYNPDLIKAFTSVVSQCNESNQDNS